MKHLGLNLLFLLPDETGGRETYARELIGAILETNPGFEITAFVNPEAEPRLKRDLGDNMRVIRIRASPRRPDLWAVGELLLVPLATGMARVDVLHSMANFGPVAGPFRRVLTLHDLQYEAVPELLSKTRRMGTSALIGLGARGADRLITVSAAMADKIAWRFPKLGDRIDVIPNGVGTSTITPSESSSSIRQRYKIGDRPIVLVVATDLPHKNLASVIDALTLIGQETRPMVVFAGAGTDSGKLVARVHAARVGSDVRLLGYCSADTLEGLYGTAACVLVPSLYEGFGLPALEAMSRGIPVACSDIPVLHEVTGGNAVQFDATDPAAIAKAMTRLLTSPKLQQTLGAAGREHAKTFSWAAAAAATLACYERVAAG